MDHDKPRARTSTRAAPAREPTGSIASIKQRSDNQRFYGITIAMFFDDHGHPHFHARHADGSAKIRIDQVDVIDSSLGVRQLRLVPTFPDSGRAAVAPTLPASSRLSANGR